VLRADLCVAVQLHSYSEHCITKLKTSAADGFRQRVKKITGLIVAENGYSYDWHH
jgi:hypothetical protein